MALGTLLIRCPRVGVGNKTEGASSSHSSRGCHSRCNVHGCTRCSWLAGALPASSACLHACSGNLLQQEYTLAHLEPPDSLEAAEARIRKFEEFLVSMENNRDKVLSPVDSGNKLVAEGNLYSDKIKEKVQLIEDRYPPPLGSRGQVGWWYSAQHHCDCGSGFPSRHRKNDEKAQEASVLLRDNLELQNFLQNCQEVRFQPGWPLCRRFLLEAECPRGGKSFLTQESGFHKWGALGT